MADIFYILKNLFTNRKSDWIINIEENEIVPHVIQLWLMMIDKVRLQTRFLDKYKYTLPSKMYLSLAWSVLPKINQLPKFQYIKTKKQDDEKYNFLFDIIKKKYEISSNDFKFIRPYIVRDLEKNKAKWFAYFGVEKKHWKANKVAYELARTVLNNKQEKKSATLFDF